MGDRSTQRFAPHAQIGVEDSGPAGSREAPLPRPGLDAAITGVGGAGVGGSGILVSALDCAIRSRSRASASRIFTPFALALHRRFGDEEVLTGAVMNKRDGERP